MIFVDMLDPLNRPDSPDAVRAEMDKQFKKAAEEKEPNQQEFVT